MHTVPNLLESSKMRISLRDAFTVNDCEFRLRVQTSSAILQSETPLQNASPERLHCRIRLRVQNAAPPGDWNLQCKTSLQNAECRPPRGIEFEAETVTSNADFECRSGL